MQSNFEFLKKDWEILANIGTVAEYNLYVDPNTTIIKTRQLAEALAKLMMKVENLNDKKTMQQHERVKILKDNDLITDDIDKIFTALRTKGNKAAHGLYGDEETADNLLSMTVKLCAWFQEVYGSDHNFSSDDISYEQPQKINYIEEYEKLVAKSNEKDTETEIEKFTPDSNQISIEERRKIIKTKKEIVLTEAETRLVIDAQLREAGWEVDTQILNYKKNKTLPEKNKNLAIAEWPCKKDNGNKGYADYALFCGNTLVALIEAKRKNVDVFSALKRDCIMYSKDIITDESSMKESVKLAETTPYINNIKVPFLYSSNARKYNEEYKEKSGLWFLDARKNNEAKVIANFHSPSDLISLLKKDIEEANEKLKNESFSYLEENLGLRYYQIEAIKAVEAALIDGKDRVLLTMATGTGKTMTALALAYRLLKTKRYNRILFVVDRAELGRQTKDSFENNKIEQQYPISKIYELEGLDVKIPSENTKIHIATVQGLMKRIFSPNSEDENLSVGMYDCIIIDEAHRGYILDKEINEEESLFINEEDFQSKYRKVIDYFDADKIALTATPATHTIEIFGQAVYQYSYRQGVIDGYLIDHETPYKIVTKLSEDGIHYELGDEIKFYDQEKDELKVLKIEDDELNFEIDAFNKKVITENFNRAVCSALVNRINPYGPEKTLIFAATDEHADMIVRILYEEYKKADYNVNYDMIQKITGSVKDIASLIKKYKNELYPTIAVTVDLLTTGVDVREITSLVFLRKVKSRILFEQMKGRATRTCDRIRKEFFRIYDAVEVYKDLKDHSDMKPVIANASLTMSELFKNINASDESFIHKLLLDKVLAKLQRKKNKIKKLGNDNFQLLANQFTSKNFSDIDEYLRYLKALPEEKIYKTLEENKEFLEYLDFIKNEDKTKIISEHNDEVKEIFQDFSGKKPEDYLENFNQFVRENQDKIKALTLLKTSPKNFTKKDLKEIKFYLDSEGFSEMNLNSAYKNMKNEDIYVNILTFVKNILSGSPIVDKKEKVEDVMKRIKKLNNWNPVQKKILESIEEILLQDDYLTKEDFNKGILKEKYGSFDKINLKLNEKLEKILAIINEEILLN